MELKLDDLDLNIFTPVEEIVAKGTYGFFHQEDFSSPKFYNIIHLS